MSPSEKQGLNLPGVKSLGKNLKTPVHSPAVADRLRASVAQTGRSDVCRT